MTVRKRKKFKISFSSKKCGFKEAVDSFCQWKRLASKETLDAV